MGRGPAQRPPRRNHGPAEPGHLLLVAAVPPWGRDRRVRNGHPRAPGRESVLAGEESWGEEEALPEGLERSIAVERR